MANYTLCNDRDQISKKIVKAISGRFYPIILLSLIFLSYEASAQAPVVTLPTSSSVLTTTATLGGTVTGTLTHRGTRWNATSPVGSSNELEEASTSAGVFTQSRSLIPAATKIFYVAYARNGVDVGVSSESAFFTEPAQLTGGQFTAASTNNLEITLSFPSADSWEGTGVTGGYVIFRKSGSAPSLGALADGAIPPADGVGDKITTITNGAATSFVNTTGLSAETDYYYTIIPFVWDGSTAATYNYNTTAPVTSNDFTFSTNPTNQPTNGSFTVTGVSSTQINLAFDNPTGLGNSDGYIILRRQDGADPTTANIQDGVDPATLATLLPAGTSLAGTTTVATFNDTGLTPSTQYRYLILPYNANGSSNAETYNYKTDGTPVTPKNDWTFATEPSDHATGSLTANPVSISQINLLFNSVTTSSITNATGYIMLIKSSAIVAADLASLNDGAAPNAFGLFEAIINSTSTNSYNDVSGLTANTTYHYAIIPFNKGADDQTYNYLKTTGFPTASATTPDISATVVPINGGTAPVIAGTVLSAGSTLQVLTGFSITSDGTQTLTDIGFNYTGLAGQFTDEFLYRSTTAGSIGTQLLSDNSPDGDFSLTSVAAGNKTINSTPVYYYLVVNVINSATQSTASITTNPTQANIAASTGTVNNFSISRTFTFGTSQSSDIFLVPGGTTNSINYRLYLANVINNDQSNSVSLADFSIRDGGGSNDPDDKGMSVTSIEVQVTNAQNLRQIALFDDGANTEIAGTEQTISGSGSVTLVFTPTTPISVADNGSFNFNVRGTFKPAVTDNHSLQISIVSATASNTALSGFSSVGTWASTQTANSTNIIAVTASKLVFLANPPSTPVNSTFSLAIKAVDGNPYNNLDLDYAGKVDLSATGGAGTLSPLGQLSPNLSQGQYTWNNILTISQAGTYTLTASDDAYTGEPANPTDIGDASGSVVITSPASNITQPSALNLCFGGNSQTLGNIVITETDPSGFSAGGTFSITLPAGFVFDQSITTAPSVGGGSDITAPSTLSYPGANIVEFSYTINGTANTNSITITGLKISRPHPGGASPSGVGGSITRSGGTATIAGVAPGTVLGTVNAALGSPAPVGLGFTVQKINSNDVDVAAGETRFSQNSNPVRLVPSPTGSPITNVFSGSGVTFVSGEYRFNPQSLSPGTYPITLVQKTGSGENCEFQVIKNFEVYTTNITNLNAQYCNNSPQTQPMNVDSYIASFYPGFSLDRFIYWDTPTFTQKNITSPANNIFDPKLALYQPIYSSTGTTYGVIGIWIGFIIYENINPLNTRTVWNLIAVRPAPSVSFTIPSTSFCADELPVTLVGNPANSNTTGDDFFSISPAGQSAALNSSSAPVTWTFSPQSVGGVSQGSPQTVSITYTYRDPSTGCSGTSAPTNITVNARPGNVLSNSITGGATKQICQGGNLTSFEATPLTSPNTYNWYSDINLTNKLGTGSSFTPPSPPFDNTTAATTNYFVTQVVAGCESNKQPTTPTQALQLSVVVNPTPNQPVPDFDIEYCIGETIDPNEFKILGGTNIRWYKDGALILDNVSSPSLSQITSATPTGLGIDNTIAKIHTFKVTQTANNCEGILFPTTINVTIKPLPKLTISSSSADPLKICTTGGAVTFKGLDNGNPTQNGTWSTVGNSFVPGALAPNGTFGTADLNTINLTPDDYTLKYEFTNALGCTNNTTLNLKVLPKINLVVSPLDSCAGLFVRINNLSTIDNGGLSSTASIVNTKWNFSDGSGAEGNGTIPPPYLNNGRTKGTYFSPEHKFNNTGSFTLQVTMTTSDGCNYSGTKQLNISPKPNINFTWANACRDDKTGTTSTQFQAVETSSPVIPLSTFLWNFKTQGILTTTAEGSGGTPLVKYNKDGIDSVKLIVTTSAGCRDTIQKVVYVVPKFKRIVTDTSYLQNFDAGPDSWLIGGKNSSWALGTPSGKANGYVFNGDATTGTGKAWDTNLTGPSNQNEQSWVLSQCFNFTASLKPAISLNIWSDTPQGVEGAVLQYNEDGKIEDDASWKVLGVLGSGVNWYDAQGIASSPGNQPSGDLGWTGNALSSGNKYSGWTNAIFKLDDLKGKPNVIFRVAFGGGPGRTDGFAFDNVFIGERSRVVLLENFTNSSAVTTPLTITQHNNIYKNAGTTAELVKIQYHTPFPGNDPINTLNTQMNNARTAFYGITQAPTMRIDGDYGAGGILLWLSNLYDKQVLTPADVRINILTTKLASGEVRVITEIENISAGIVPLAGAHVFTAVVEKSITSSTLLGSSGNSEFVFVAKEFLPSASGKKIPTNLLVGATYRDTVMWKNLTGDALVAFVQNIESSNKNVFQSQIRLDPDLPNLITGIETTLPDQVSIYPNPAHKEFKVELPTTVQTEVGLNLIDQMGRKYEKGVIPSGGNSATINVENLSEGIYILEIGSSGTGIIRKKIMVVMKN